MRIINEEQKPFGLCSQRVREELEQCEESRFWQRNGWSEWKASRFFLPEITYQGRDVYRNVFTWFLENLDDPYQSLAIARTNVSNLNKIVDTWDNVKSSQNSFSWLDSKEGLDFWHDVFDGKTPPIPKPKKLTIWEMC